MIDQYPGTASECGPAGPKAAADLCRRLYRGDVPFCGTARLSSCPRVGSGGRAAEQYQVIKDAFAAEGVPLANAHITVNRFCHITDSKEHGLRFAENARYQSRLASSLRRRQEVMQGTVLV